MVDGISEGAVDLFGLPLAVARGRGRPAHQWTLENSNKVNLLFACGKRPAEVWPILGITKPTFLKYYFNEIARAGHARLMLRAIQLERLNAEAAKGNVAAEKALAAMVQAERLNSDAAMIGQVRPAKAAAKGKKDLALERAWDAGKGDRGWGNLLHDEPEAGTLN